MIGNNKALKLIISLAAIVTSLTGSAAFAGNNGSDIFERNTGTSPSTIPSEGIRTPSGYVKPPAEVWFDRFDEAILSRIPNQQETYALTRDFGTPPQLERVVFWTNTAASVAKRYRELSRILKTTPLAPAMISDPMSSELNNYKQSLAEWYGDSASLLEDYIKPRPAARTKDELEDQLNQMTQRSQRLKDSFQHLSQMDSQIREHFKVHTLDDKTHGLWNYVTKPLPK